MGPRIGTITCARCGQSLQDNSRFCPQCGAAVGDGGTVEIPQDPVAPRGAAEAPLPPPGTPPLPPNVHQAHRRPLGFPPAQLLGAAGVMLLVLAVIVSATGGWLLGIILLGLAIAALTLCISALRQEPTPSPALRTVSTVGDRARGSVRVLVVSGRTWSGAGLQLIRIRERRRRLKREMKAQLQPLGEAALREDQTRLEALRADAARLEQALEETDREASAVVGKARAAVEQELGAVQATTPMPTVGDPATPQPESGDRTPGDSATSQPEPGDRTPGDPATSQPEPGDRAVGSRGRVE